MNLQIQVVFISSFNWDKNKCKIMEMIGVKGPKISWGQKSTDNST